MKTPASRPVCRVKQVASLPAEALSGSSAATAWRIPAAALAIFNVAAFLSAALLFLVEPMFAKMALPLLGGSAAVWTTCLVFFQGTLLAGYAYAHGLAHWLGRRAQFALHGGVLLSALLVLPIHIPTGSNVPHHGNPVLWLLGLLLLALGLPFFALSATTPILQNWFATSGHPQSADPYFLYAASNAGSLLGLLSYPLALEPLLGLRDQDHLWAGGYLLLLVLMAACILFTWQTPESTGPPIVAEGNTAAPGNAAIDPAPYPTLLQRLRWVLAAFVPSSLMLGVTTALTTDIPPIPLFWVLPLAVYLLSFVLVFARKSYVPHAWLRARVPLLIVAAAIPVILKGALPLVMVLLIDLLMLFAVALICHGELAHSRPATRHLTQFYFWVALGGVLGGVFNALLAPRIFSMVLEYPIALVLAAILCAPNASKGPEAPRARQLDYLFPLALWVAVAVAIRFLQAHGVPPGREFNILVFAPAAICCLRFATRPRRFGLGVAALVLASRFYGGPYGHIIHTERSFYGVYRVADDPQGEYRVLFHGGTAHGVQSLDPARACDPLAYYSRRGPFGEVFQAFQGSPVEQNVAVIGLGAGVMACYHEPQVRLTFYEIDPAVAKLAQNQQLFTYLSNCAPQARIVLGDARLALRRAPAHAYGTIVLDAFSGDSIPTHLLTREALALYLEKLAAHGVLVFHVSNRYLDLHGVLAALARDAGLVCFRHAQAAITVEDARQGNFASWWVVMARQWKDLQLLVASGDWRRPDITAAGRVWTDDFSDIISIMRFH